MGIDFIEVVLTCGSWEEAHNIVDVLLDKKLVACVEMSEVKSKYLWQNEVEEADEIKLTMKSVASHFETIEAEVKKLHSYDTFVLEALPVTRINEEAAKWLEENTSQDVK